MRLATEWQGTRHPPGNFPFKDARTGHPFDPNAGGMRDRIADVQKHRRANPTVYLSTEPQYFDANFIQQQIEDFMCNLRPEICGEAPKLEAKVNVLEIPMFACAKCSATDWKARYCPTCAGQRVEGFTCNACGNRI